MKKYFIFFITNIVLLFVDRFTKVLSILKLKSKPEFIVIKNFFSFEYVENSGGAWGILNNFTFFLILISALFIILTTIIYFRLCKNKSNKLLKCSLLLVISGATGNLYDRIIYGYVIDFISLKFIRFPVFNVSDIYISVGMIFIVILIFFIYKEEDLSILKKSILNK